MMARSVSLAVLAAAALAGGVAAQERVDVRRPTGATGDVQIHNVAGSVRVVGWDRNEVHVTGTLGRGTDRLDVHTEGGDVVVRVVVPRGARNVQGSSIEVRVPARKTVAANGVSADVDVSGVDGGVEARSVSGNVAVTGTPREAVAQSQSGNVRVDVTSSHVEASSVSGEVTVAGDVRGSVEATAVSGNVTVTARTGEVRATAVSGNVTVAAMSGRAEVQSVSGDVQVTGRALHGAFQTVSGNVRLTGDLARDGSTDISSHSGDVELRLSSGASAEVEVTTFSGSIENALAGARVERISRREHHITIGRGDARVAIQTFSGSVKLTGR